MFGKLFLEPMYSKNYALSTVSNYRLKSSSLPSSRVYSNSTTSKSDLKMQKSFEEFKKMQVKSFDLFKESPSIKIICGDDNDKITQAYQGYCLGKYNRYIHTLYGGNPSTII
ncbi:MAG: hypothetical protein H0V82_01655 [Candidatus Protochlamydia sp.]|nr:hypothetical protein [Candidatus Protochlamydia sp.]